MRSKSPTLVLLLGLLAILTQAHGGPANDRDAAVIRTSLESFFSIGKWQMGFVDDRGTCVVVGTQYESKSRPNFSELLEEIIARLKKDPSSRAEYGRLLIFRNQLSKKNGARPGDLAPLKSMDLGPKVVVLDLGRRQEFYPDKPVEVTNRQGKKGLLRARGTVRPPTYSSDGTAAIVELCAVPWGIHGGDIRFVLKLTAGKWTVFHVDPLVYP